MYLSRTKLILNCIVRFLDISYVQISYAICSRRAILFNIPFKTWVEKKICKNQGLFVSRKLTLNFIYITQTRDAFFKKTKHDFIVPTAQNRS